MNISEMLSPTFTEFDISTPLSKIAGTFENQELDVDVLRSLIHPQMPLAVG